MAPINVYDFIDNLNANSNKRREFIKQYVHHLANVMDGGDIIDSWVEMVKDQEERDAKDNGIDGLVEQVCHYYPDFIKSMYDVDTSLMEN